MNESSNRIRAALPYVGALLIVLGLIGMWVYMHHSSGGATSSTASSTATSTSPIEVNPDGPTTVTTPSGTYTVTPVYASSSAAQAPSVSAPLIFSVSVAADEKALIQKNFDAAQTALKKDPKDVDAWVALGVTRKEAGDYAGAALDWEYASKLAPTNVASFHNLGDLYKNYLHKYSLAVANYKQAAINNPHDLDAYRSIYYMETGGQYAASESAIETNLNTGFTRNPGAFDLGVLLADYYASQGDAVHAKSTYLAAAKAAAAQGQNGYAAQLTAKANAL